MKRLFLFPLACLLALAFFSGPAAPAMAQTDAEAIRETVSVFYENYQKAGYIENLSAYLQKQPQVDPAFIKIMEKRYELEADGDLILMTQSDFLGLEYGNPFIDGNTAEITVYKLWKEGKDAHGVLLSKKDGSWRITDIVRTHLLMGDFDSLHGAVDEAEFRRSLKAWIRLCNGFIRQFRDLTPEEADKLFQKNASFQNLQHSGELDDLDDAVRPVLNRWGEYGGTENIGPDDRAVSELLEEYGIRFASAEGYPMLLVNQAYFSNMLSSYLSQATVSYLATRANQPEHYYDVSACYYSHEEMGNWAVIWERFLDRHGASYNGGYAEEAAKNYKAIMDYLLFSELSATPAFSRQDGKMQEDWVTGLRGIAADHPGTETANIVLEFLKAIEADGNTLSAANKNAFTAKIEAVGSRL